MGCASGTEEELLDVCADGCRERAHGEVALFKDQGGYDEAQGESAEDVPGGFGFGCGCVRGHGCGHGRVRMHTRMRGGLGGGGLGEGKRIEEMLGSVQIL